MESETDSFRRYFEKYRPKCSMSYPFLSPSQIRSKLLERWRKSSSYNKRRREVVTFEHKMNKEAIKLLKLQENYGADTNGVLLSNRHTKAVALEGMAKKYNSEYAEIAEYDDIKWEPYPKPSTSSPRWLNGDTPKIKVMTPQNREELQKKREKSTPDSGLSSPKSEVIEISDDESKSPLESTSINTSKITKEVKKEVNYIIKHDVPAPLRESEEREISFKYDESTRELCYLFPSDDEKDVHINVSPKDKGNEPEIAIAISSFDEICAANISNDITEVKCEPLDTHPFVKGLGLPSKLGSPFCYQPSFEDVCAMHGIDSSIEIDDLKCDLLVDVEQTDFKISPLHDAPRKDTNAIPCKNLTATRKNKKTKIKTEYEPLTTSNNLFDRPKKTICGVRHKYKKVAQSPQMPENLSREKSAENLNVSTLPADAVIKSPNSTRSAIENIPNEFETAIHSNAEVVDIDNKSFKSEIDPKLVFHADQSNINAKQNPTRKSEFMEILKPTLNGEISEKLSTEACSPRSEKNHETPTSSPNSMIEKSNDDDSSSIEITSGQPITQSSSSQSEVISQLKSISSFDHSNVTTNSQPIPTFTVDKKLNKRHKKSIEDIVTKLKCEKEKLMRQSQSSDSLNYESTISTPETHEETLKSDPRVDEAKLSLGKVICNKQPVVVLRKLQLDNPDGHFDLRGVKFWTLNKSQFNHEPSSDSTWTDLTDSDDNRNTPLSNTKTGYQTKDDDIKIGCSRTKNDMRKSGTDMLQLQPTICSTGPLKKDSEDYINKETSTVFETPNNYVLADVLVHREDERSDSESANENCVLNENDIDEYDRERCESLNDSEKNQWLCDLFDD